jgi:phenylalanyl-tRNA synthetase beta chain
MRVPVRWLREYVDLPSDLAPRALQARLIAAGLEVETVTEYDVEGPFVVGRVLAFDDEAQKNGKTIRWCRVDVGAGHNGPDGARGIVCGALNFDVGDLVVVALPGSVLPGGIEIGARRTYGHVSDGMICSLRELGLGDDNTGILVLTERDADTAVPGDDARPVLGLPDAVLEISVKPDRSYCLSMRGIAREASIAYAVDWRDPAHTVLPEPGDDPHPVEIADLTGADRIVLRRLVGFDPQAQSPLWLRSRLHLAGMRPVSLAVDITNYVMHELGQPLHAFDGTLLRGPIVVRRANPGERLETLDHVVRELDEEDLLITDDRGPIALAGTMGGLETEIGESSTEIVLEAAHFLPVPIARQSRRHKLASEASRRFERGVDPTLGPVASARAAALLAEHGGATLVGTAEVDMSGPGSPIKMHADYPSRVAGMDYDPADVVRRLEQVGCSVVTEPGLLTVQPPPWRPDLCDPADLAEEVLRLEGYDRIPSRLPHVLPGRGFSLEQRHFLTATRALAEQGFVEVKAYPFVSGAVADDLGLPSDDPRRRMLRLANPLSEAEPFLASSLLPGLLTVARRNIGRGFTDLALFQVSRVMHPTGQEPPAPRPDVDRRPDDDTLATLYASVPPQPRHIATVLVGAVEQGGWWGRGRDARWADAIEAARTVARSIDVPVTVRPAQVAPWHPGRCAEVVIPGEVRREGEDLVVGWAGELHPRVCATLELPARTCAMEISMTALMEYAEPLEQGPPVSAFPVATRDIALVVPADVPAAEVESALSAGAGDLLESVRLFDVYAGEELGAGRRSLAYRIWLRADDRTLTTDEANAARDHAIAEAARRVGAVART